ncbi:MAG: hypothetical protein GTO22_21000, partial [Gemmatimonadales bacterium]|nr:hypothetical protein [Gemmatimonadales bacterium]
MVRVQNNLGTLGALIPIFEIELQHGGRTKRVNAGFDTGASRTTVIMGPELAQELGLKLENPHKILGFGGSQTAYDAHLESVRVVDA